MGSSPWTHWAPWEPDVAAALQRQRMAVFASGSYTWERAPLPRPATLQALEAELESGTGTVIDAFRIGPAPSLATAGALSTQRLREFFGSERPDRQAIERGLPQLWGTLQRGDAAHVLSYQGEVPAEICFTGFAVDVLAYADLSGPGPASSTPKPVRAGLFTRLLSRFGNANAATPGSPLARLQPSEALAPIVGAEPLTRVEATQRLWSYIRQHGLQDPGAQGQIRADDQLRVLFGGQEVINMFELTQKVNENLRPLG